MTVRITVNTRGSWYQVTEWTLASREVYDRINLIAEFDYKRYGGRAFVLVRATDLETGGHIEVSRSDRPRLCRHCGEEL